MYFSAFSRAQSDVLGSYSPEIGMSISVTGAERERPHSVFRLSENSVTSYRCSMTTAGNFRTVATRVACEVDVAGVPWPAYKLIALVLGAVVAVLVGLVTLSAGPAVLAGAAAGAASWLSLRAYCARR
jgi:hypothetical protein